MQRIPEPELMTDEAQCEAYALADFGASNQAFVDVVRSRLPAGATRVLDIGCGPADVMIRLASSCPTLQITAVDGSPAMIRLADNAIEESQSKSIVKTMVAYVPGLPLPAAHYDVVLSKDFLHHLPDPMVLWQEVQRLARTGAFVCVMDLRRPECTATARKIVDSIAANEAEVLRADFYNSLLAAFTLDEIRDQLRVAGLNLDVSIFGDRHLLIAGYVA